MFEVDHDRSSFIIMFHTRCNTSVRGGINTILDAADLVTIDNLKNTPRIDITNNYKLEKTEEFGIYLLDILARPSERDAVIGDILEARNDIRERHGERKAKIYFWWQVTRSVLHFAFSAIKRLRWIAAALDFFGWVARRFSS